jgi:hypothetical protein
MLILDGFKIPLYIQIILVVILFSYFIKNSDLIITFYIFFNTILILNCTFTRLN